MSYKRLYVNASSLISIALLFISIFSPNALAQKYKTLSEIDNLRNPGKPFSFFLDAQDSVGILRNIPAFDDPQTYTAPANSVFNLIFEQPQVIDNDQFFVVKFTKVPKTGDTYVKEDQVYYFPIDKFYPFVLVEPKSQFDWGVLTVPFKFRFKPNVITPSASIGPYAGMRFYLNHNWSLSTIGSAALAGISLNDVNADDVENVMGLTLSMGPVLSYKNGQVQLGLILGTDIIGGNKGEDWIYEGKPWLAFSTGFSFTKWTN